MRIWHCVNDAAVLFVNEMVCFTWLDKVGGRVFKLSWHTCAPSQHPDPQWRDRAQTPQNKKLQS